MPIPTYRANGRRVSDSSRERALRLLGLKLVSASYDRHGHIRRIMFLSDPGGYALSKTPPTGHQPVYRELIADQFYIWTFKQ